MADEQILTTCTLTNGDATVVCAGNTFLTTLDVNDTVKIDADNEPVYHVGSVTDNTHFEMTANFAGTTGSYSVIIQRSFSTNLHLAKPKQGDHDWGDFLADVIDDIDTKLGSLINSLNDLTLFLNWSPSADHLYNGLLERATAGENLVYGELCYLKSDGKYWKADADAATSMPGTALACASISADATGTFLKFGYMRHDAWDWSTVGGLLFVDTATTGGMTQTAPSGTGDQVQCVGYAKSADIIFFNPALVIVEIT